MANRLPIVGSDNNNWGTILDQFLSVSLNSDGTINAGALTTAGGVTNTTTAGGVLSGTYPSPTFLKAAATSSGTGNPTATASTSLVMMGLGFSYTPQSTGTTLAIVTATGLTNTVAVPFTVSWRKGTGTVPVFGAAATGSTVGAGTYTLQAPSATTPTAFSFVAMPALTVGVSNWFDFALSTSNASDTAQVSNVRMCFMETA